MCIRDSGYPTRFHVRAGGSWALPDATAADTTVPLTACPYLTPEHLRLEDALHKLDKFPALILDDFGYVKKTEQETQVLFELIAHRYETGSLIITSNQPFAEWDRIFPDQMMTVAAVDRLVHHATIIEVSSDSYRRKEALGQVVVRTPTAITPTTTTIPASVTTTAPVSRDHSGDAHPDTPSG